jgi:hypothetical protein
VTFFVRGVLRHKKILLTRPSPWLR